MVALNPGSTVTLDPSFKLKLVELKVPIRTAEATAPLTEGPVKDKPSGSRLKKPEPKVWGGPLTKFTVKLRLERLIESVTGHVVSGKGEELGPV